MTIKTPEIPEYDEDIVCQNPECKHVEAAAITGLYGMAGGGGLGVYSLCEHCGAILSKSIDPAAVCDTLEEEPDAITKVQGPDAK